MIDALMIFYVYLVYVVIGTFVDIYLMAQNIDRWTKIQMRGNNKMPTSVDFVRICMFGWSYYVYKWVEYGRKENSSR